MIAQIKRNNWSRFCKKFNITNQLRNATVSVKHEGGNEVEINQNSPFLGISIAKKGRLIDAVDLFTGQYDPEKLTEPVVSVKQPVKMVLEKDNDDKDNRLTVESKDGTMAQVILCGEKVADQRKVFVEKVAYSMYEQRGFTSGGDVDDWLEAERRIREIELQLVQ